MSSSGGPPVSEPSNIVGFNPAEAVKLGAESLVTYGRLFFPRTIRQNPAPAHYEIGRELYSLSRFNAVKMARGFAKTTWLRVYTSQRIAYGISRTIMYTSVSQQHATFSIRWLKRQIQYNRQWADAFGLKKGSKWTDEHIEIIHGIEEVPINVLALGITGQIRGFNLDDFRPDLIIGDDLCNEENTATPEQRKKLSDLFFGGLANSLAPASEIPSAKLVLLQTPLHKEDLIEVCMKDPSWHGISVSCFTPDGESAWPARWTTEELVAAKAAHRLRGQYALWMREMEVKVVNSEEKTFNTGMLQYWEEAPKRGKVALAIDPASSESKTADDNVILTGALVEGRIFVLEYHAATGVMPDLAATKFFEQVFRWGVMRAVSESISYQRVLAWFLEQEMQKRKVWVPIRKIQDRRKKSDRIVQAISFLLHTGKIVVHRSMEKLIQQLEDYDPTIEQHDDVIDALSMLIMELMPNLLEQQDDEESDVIEDDEDGNPLITEFRGAP